ncbi:MAG TPA: M48 family metallopeptidase [Candidatus Angelobacter sp.]|nr:M48 family metallopeptidase [Candidatus Angelobacter sp.]
MALHSRFSKILSSVLALLMMQQGALWAAQTAPQLPDPGRTGLDRQQQEKLGLQAMGEVYKQMPVLPDSSPVTRYVQQLGNKLARVIPPDNSWPYQFHVVQASDINAFALPGGPIFVNIGTIQAADNEAELAGVMAHEMSHIYMQHSAKQAPKAAWAGIISGLAGAVLGQSAAGSLARMGIQFGAGTLLMKYSRKDEAQADAVGAIIAYNSGYNPQSLADFFTKLEQRYGQGGPQFLSDHPNPGNREAAIQQEIQDWPARKYNTNNSTFLQARQEAKSIRAYSAQEISQGAQQNLWLQHNQKNGSLRSGTATSENVGVGDNGSISNVAPEDIRPSNQLRQYQGQGFIISYPDNWRVSESNSSVTIAPSGGASGGNVTYGAIISGFQPNSQDIVQATDDLIANMRQSNPGLQPMGSARTIQVSGVSGRSVELTGNSPLQGQRERDWLATVPAPGGNMFYTVFVAPEKDFEQLRPTYETMLRSLRVQ